MIHLEIVTPSKKVLSVDADEVQATSVDGKFGVRTGHVPFITLLKQGEVVYVNGSTKTVVQTSEGFAQVADNKVVILVEDAKTA